MPNQPVALVLAGGGARGAYEAGVLSTLLPALPPDQRPNLIVGSSVGAINGAYVAATLPGGGDPSLATGREVWEHLRWGDVLATPSLRDLERLARGTLNFTGLFSLDVPALLDAAPLEKTLRKAIPFARIQEHVDNGDAARRRGGGHVRAHRPQRRLPLRRDAGRAARRQARDRLRAGHADRAPRARLGGDPGALPGGEIEPGRPPAGTSTAARA